MQPTRVDFSVVRQDGWIRQETSSSAWVVRQADGSAVIFNPHCTHLGCAYNWYAADKLFRCPCHGGVFDIQGNVVSGPPPRPLDRLAYTIEGGRLIVTE